MNEERFVIISTNEFEGRIYDRFDDDFLNLEQILDLLNDYEKNILILTMMDLPEMENMLIKQSSIIRKDEISINTMLSNMEKLEKENEQLKSERKTDLKEFSQLFKQNFAQKREINDLKKENKELQKELDSFRPVIFHTMQRGTITLYTKGGIDE